MGKIHVKISSAKWQPICSCLDDLTHITEGVFICLAITAHALYCISIYMHIVHSSVIVCDSYPAKPLSLHRSPHYWSLWGLNWSPMDSPHKRPITRPYAFFVVGLNKLNNSRVTGDLRCPFSFQWMWSLCFLCSNNVLNKQSNPLWYETSKRSCVLTVMRLIDIDKETVYSLFDIDQNVFAVWDFTLSWCDSR